MKVSENFSLSEITSLKESELTPVQLYMIRNLTQEILEPFRTFLGCKIKVVSGLRDLNDYHRIVAQGGNPSDTSDHFFGLAVPVRSRDKVKRYGETYTYSVGAVDIVPEIGAKIAFQKLKPFFSSWQGVSVVKLPNMKEVRVGQLIYELGNRTDWIHASNPATLVYSNNFVQKFLKKSGFMISLENGKPGSYQSI